ncbi:MAG TPA: radical SAM protein, partial [Rectinemataceae bacterium]|nr:radical SAM protein [Rectinemataceae bacterium]
MASPSGGVTLGGEGASFLAPRSLYIHVPICASKCAYCDFFSLPSASWSEAAMASLVDATLARAAVLAERFGASGFDTVYVGGGTPTALPPVLLDRLLAGIGSLAGRPGEWTVEANPESLDARALETMRARGVSRISL